MVVGVTLATIYLLRTGGSKGGASLLAPAGLAEAVEKEIDDPEQRAAALEVIASMSQLVDEWDQNLRITLDLYLQAVQQYDTDVTQMLEEVIGPMENKRSSVLQSQIGLREKLRKLLPEDRWNDVFGN